MRVNLKELIEKLEKIKMFGIHKSYPKGTEFYRVIEIPEDKLREIIHELKQLENIYNQ